MPDDQQTAPTDGASAHTHTGDRLIAVFLLGVVFFHPLVLGIFDVGAEITVFGIPLLFVSLFAMWGILIIGLRLALRPDRPPPPPAPSRRPRPALSARPQLPTRPPLPPAPPPARR